eukprot:15329019-Ditylum_brightwellii.AAC.1
MMRAQNYFLENQKSIAVTGFDNIKHHVLGLEVLLAEEDDECMEGVDPPTVPIHVWMLWKRSPDKSKLVTSIERGPRGVYYFCTSEEKIPKMT